MNICNRREFGNSQLNRTLFVALVWIQLVLVSPVTSYKSFNSSHSLCAYCNFILALPLKRVFYLLLTLDSWLLNSYYISYECFALTSVTVPWPSNWDQIKPNPNQRVASGLCAASLHKLIHWDANPCCRHSHWRAIMQKISSLPLARLNVLELGPAVSSICRSLLSTSVMASSLSSIHHHHHHHHCRHHRLNRHHYHHWQHVHYHCHHHQPHHPTHG